MASAYLTVDLSEWAAQMGKLGIRPGPLREAAHGLAEALAEVIRDTVPVASGNLRDSVEGRVSGWKVMAGSPLPYASFRGVGEETPELLAAAEEYLAAKAREILGVK